MAYANYPSSACCTCTRTATYDFPESDPNATYCALAAGSWGGEAKTQQRSPTSSGSVQELSSPAPAARLLRTRDLSPRFPLRICGCTAAAPPRIALPIPIHPPPKFHGSPLRPSKLQTSPYDPPAITSKRDEQPGLSALSSFPSPVFLTPPIRKAPPPCAAAPFSPWSSTRPPGCLPCPVCPA